MRKKFRTSPCGIRISPTPSPPVAFPDIPICWALKVSFEMLCSNYASIWDMLVGHFFWVFVVKNGAIFRIPNKYLSVSTPPRPFLNPSVLSLVTSEKNFFNYFCLLLSFLSSMVTQFNWILPGFYPSAQIIVSIDNFFMVNCARSGRWIWSIFPSVWWMICCQGASEFIWANFQQEFNYPVLFCVLIWHRNRSHSFALHFPPNEHTKIYQIFISQKSSLFKTRTQTTRPNLFDLLICISLPPTIKKVLGASKLFLGCIWVSVFRQDRCFFCSKILTSLG